jgi:DNA-binding LacI/PurR family transcriptional regulator
VATISDVATAAGVATSTVSRYLSGKLSVTADTERRIRAAADALGYVANHSARTLASGRTDVVGLVVPELSNPFFAVLADLIVDEAAQRGLAVLVGSTRGNQSRESNYSDRLASGLVDGLIYVGMHRTNDRLASVVRAGLPVVVADEPLNGLPEVDTVVVDNFAGAFQATSYLLGLGHGRVAYVGGPPELYSAQERLRGYTAALHRVGQDIDKNLIQSGSYTEEFGVNVLPHLLSQGRPPTAIFAASDFIALGLLRAAETYSLDVPGDLSLTGFDDIPLNSRLRPRLTSVAQPVDQIARVCIDLLVARIRTPGATPQTRTLPVTLTVRDSAAPLQPAEKHSGEVPHPRGILINAPGTTELP